MAIQNTGSITGDLGIRFVPVNYTRQISSPNSTSTDQLTSHLNGIDVALTDVRASSITTIADASIITPDFALSQHFKFTLGGNRTLANPSNLVAGQSGVIFVIQDVTGNRTLSYGSYWKFPNGVPSSLSTAGNSIDLISYIVLSSTDIRAQLIPQYPVFTASLISDFTSAVQAATPKTPTEYIQPATITLTAAKCSSTIISNYGQSAISTLTLPAAAVGYDFTFSVVTTGWRVNIKANTGDKIYLNGTALDDGDKVSLTVPAIGNSARFFSFKTGGSSYDWFCHTLSGTWTDGGA